MQIQFACFLTSYCMALSVRLVNAPLFPRALRVLGGHPVFSPFRAGFAQPYRSTVALRSINCP